MTLAALGMTPHPASRTPHPASRLPHPTSLVIQTSFLGDVVLTTPLIAELAHRGPVDVVITPAAAPLLANNPDVRTLYVYDKRGRDAGMRGLLRMARRIRGDDSHGSAYLAQGSLRSALIARLAGAAERVGFDTSAARALYTKRVPHRTDRHHAERLWRLAFPDEPAIEPCADALRPRLYPGEDDVAAVDALLQPFGGDAPLVVLAPGSVWGTKRWPYYPELAKTIAGRARLAVIGGSGDAELAAAIENAVGPRPIVNAVGALSLLASAELIRRAALLVTNDSSPQHLASAMGTPTITLFGPTVPAFGFGPLAPRSIALGHPALDCRPCHHHGPATCPLRHWRCMRELTVGDVVGAVEAILPLSA
ncbi:MAG TPA: glycosyltransferase family 9 protein [Gemmatimonadaceae bacterium]